jgi:hypothetical protein
MVERGWAPGADPALDHRPKLEWRVSLVKDSVDPTSPRFNAKAARAKLMSQPMGRQGRQAVPVFGPASRRAKLAHKDSEMACFTCHLSWTTSCGGCHLPIEANWKTGTHRYEGDGDAQLRHLQPAGGARRHVPARAPHDGEGQ